jgi:hypothetical protein
MFTFSSLQNRTNESTGEADPLDFFFGFLRQSKRDSASFAATVKATDCNFNTS